MMAWVLSAECWEGPHRQYYTADASLLIAVCWAWAWASQHQTWKNELYKLRGVQFFFGFSAKLVHFSANFRSLNTQIKNNFKNVIFIACKWCKICKYYVYSISMVISLSPVKRKKKNAFGLNFWFMWFCRDLKFVIIYAFFPPNLYSQKFRVHKKLFFSPSLPSTSGSPGVSQKVRLCNVGLIEIFYCFRKTRECSHTGIY